MSNKEWEKEWEEEELKTHCRGCDKTSDFVRPITHHWWARNDNYGIYTGTYCNECYNDPNIYTYRKHDYFDEAYAGERLEEDY